MHNWDEMESMDTVDEMRPYFLHTLNTMIDHHCPEIVTKIRLNPKINVNTKHATLTALKAKVYKRKA